MFGEAVGRDDAGQAGLEALHVLIVEEFGGGFLARSVHSPGVSVAPGMIRLRQSIFDAMVETNAIGDVRSEKAPGWSLLVLGWIGEGHAVIGRGLVPLVRKGRDDVSEESSTFDFSVAGVELNASEFRDAVAW